VARGTLPGDRVVRADGVLGAKRGGFGAALRPQGAGPECILNLPAKRDGDHAALSTSLLLVCMPHSISSLGSSLKVHQTDAAVAPI
jgi:hypothetical protein